MPGGDRTGPLGQGAMTGGGRGRCADAGSTYTNPFTGRFFGRGFGFGRGRGFCMGRGIGIGSGFPYTTQNEAEMLTQEAQHLEASLKEIKKRLVQLEEKPKKDNKDNK